MALPRWRNPYAPINKKSSPAAGKAGSLAVTPTQKNSKIPAVDLRASVSKMRSNLKGISSTIRQMEETMDTLYGAMDMIESLGKVSTSSKKQLPVDKPSNRVREDHAHVEESDNSSPLSGIDVNQLLSILQSPLVQSLLNQNQTAGTKRKKEG